MILVNSILVNNNNIGGTYYTNIFLVENNTIEDITEIFNGIEYGWRKYNCNNNWQLKMSYWTWTAFNIIKDFLMVDLANNKWKFSKKHWLYNNSNHLDNIIDISINKS